MKDVIRALFAAGFKIWDNCINFAGKQFYLSTQEAGEKIGIWDTIENLFFAVKNSAIPLATLFFIIAIYKSVVSSPPEQALKKFLSDALKYAVVLLVIDKLDKIILAIMEYANLFAKSFGMAGESNLSNGREAANVKACVESLDMDLGGVDVMDFGATIENFFEQMGPFILLFISGVITILVLVGSGLTVIGIAYQRIIKPLIMIPLSAIVLSMSCCSDEGSKTLWSMGKSFLGLCISGGFFVFAIRLGQNISGALLTLAPVSDASGGDATEVLLAVVGANMCAIITTGLLKSMDAMVQKTFS
ncbi:hypothetical protein SAMN04487829_1989 [Pseudobutyrivibrio sp. NOR37]|uniref:Uncharacterized protein n=1 Tax=Pseudobutyrivibrio xylanivorans TaxID=185007 RepID=A0A6M0LIP4_PSEXY|nr:MULTISPECIES: hypothetical protein [Pseudobutyrivibrio]NEX02362.1 hypothetical protein [Pseudobutyrivibrio xylanivorans]SFR78517.1 hypothetical protein SAMN04487829_1989 [Pseudobutyrivibrio sp. NOR37]